MVTSVVGIVVCRVGAVLLLVQGAKSLQFVLPGLIQYSGGFDPSIVFFFLTTLTPVGAGLALWFLAERICSVKIGSADIEIRSSLTGLDLLGIGTLLIGLYALFYGITGGLYAEASIWSQAASLRDRPELRAETSWQDFSTRVSYVSQMLLGAGLVLGRRRIAELLAKARYAGRGVPE